VSKIFVRERRHVGEGARRPRFAIVATEGTGLHIHRPYVRRAELEKIATEIGAEIVYLPRGEHADDQDQPLGFRHGGRRRRQPDE